jgi:cytoskeletal protein CcmA (bactofilin family)
MLHPNGKATPDVTPETWKAESPRPLPQAAAVPGTNRPSPASASASGPNPGEPLPPTTRQAIDVSTSGMSVISEDLTILGQDVRVVSKGKIRVDGEIQGDVLGTEVVIGDIGKVAGVVSAKTVTVFGSILGTIRGARVLLEAGAKVEGDVHHQTLSVHEGAQFEGRVRRARDLPKLSPDATESSAPN